jgi:glycosyltransferase involved in cell wall biosynthesis
MQDPPAGSDQTVDVSFVLPCLNEVRSLEFCIGLVREALAQLHAKLRLTGEILVADNGSTDGSKALALRLGARVVSVSERGYGAALRGGFEAARGRYLVMGDADGSYDFREAVAMVEALKDGADFCIGSRFKGEVKPGAMPWKNRYIGNPVLTGVLNLLFRTGVSDAHCGLRALTKSSFERLGLTGAGMEFASEMIIKAALKGERIVEVPASLSPDLRGRAPHLRPWRDGWRHLRYLVMLSPLWLYALPALVSALCGTAILGMVGWNIVFDPRREIFFGDHWTVLAAAMIAGAHLAAVMGAAAHLHGVREGYRRPARWEGALQRWINLETMLIAGVASLGLGFIVLLGVLFSWWTHHYGRGHPVFFAVVGTLLTTLGAQNVLGGFMLAIINGHQAKFLTRSAVATEEDPVGQAALGSPSR